MNRPWPRSLTVRVIAFSSVWAILTLVVAGGLISRLYQQTASRGFEELLAAQLYNLVTSVTATEEGNLSGSPDLGDLRYSQPLSGWYWEVVPANKSTLGHLSSMSIGLLDVPSLPLDLAPFDAQYRRSYDAAGPDGQKVRVVEAEVVLDGENRAARFRVMGNASLVDADVSQFNHKLVLYLGVFGLGSVLINALGVFVGLKPLAKARRALREVRAGRAERLSGTFPVEIRPLVEEMNALLENNRRIVERARTQVGNLAHSLKTPIAVLRNEAATIGGEKGAVIAEQSETMRVQVQHYLDRARAAAQAETTVFRTPVLETLERLLRVIQKLNPDLRISFEPGEGAIVFAGERQDFEEMIGNLLENATKWARTTVRLRCEKLDDGQFAASVEDDGLGLSPDEMQEALKRGRRLDEAKPGTGLGLSIVKDLARDYRGDLVLSRSDLGGLKAVVTLPQALGEDAS